MIVFLWISLGLANSNPDKLVAAIERAIKRHYIIHNPFDITVNDGTVTLKGKINSLQGKYRIYEYVSSVPGVNFIQNDLEVNVREIDNAILHEKITERLLAVRSISNPNLIKISVNNGVVTLTGEVIYYREKLILDNYFSHQVGVREIINYVKVTPPKVPVPDDLLNEELLDIVENRFYGENRIEYSVNKGIAIIKGQVHTLFVKEKVEEEFLRVVGVLQVINNLKIDDYE